ncbi:MAG: tetratricopeptide repeat protein [Bdellovibrionales bacterium]
MLNFLNCPRCHQAISDERQQSNPVICDSCGYILTLKQSDVDQSVRSRFRLAAVAIATLVSLSFLQVANWGDHALGVLRIQARHLVGLASAPELERMARICFSLKKYSCSEKMYAELARHDRKHLIQLGHLQLRLHDFHKAAQSYGRFFAEGGEDLEARYHYARALGEIGRIDDASALFESVLAAKPDVLQITVLRHYLHALITSGRHEQAGSVIEKFKTKDESVVYYFNAELKKIEERRRPAQTS